MAQQKLSPVRAGDAEPGLGCSLLGSLDTQFNTKSALKKQAPRSRFYRQYSIMRRLRDLGINADGISPSDGPPLDNIYAQVAGVDIIVDAAGTDLAWLAGRDVFIARERQGRIFEPGPDDPSDALVILPLRLAAEIALAAEDIFMRTATRTASEGPG